MQEIHTNFAVSRWFTPNDIIRYVVTIVLALAVGWAAYQVNISNTDYRLKTVEAKAEKLEREAITQKQFDQLVEMAREIKQDIRELRAEIREGRK